MSLFKPKDLIDKRFMPLFLGGEYFAKFLLYLLRFNKLNKLYNSLSDREGLDFINDIIESFDYKIEFSEEDLLKIPQEGPVVIVSNHPFGGFDALLLIKLITAVRSDVKVLANPLLQKIDLLSDFFIADDFFRKENRTKRYESLTACREHIEKQGVLCVFPSGDITTYGAFDRHTDMKWQYDIIRFIKYLRVPIIPAFFQGTNSRLYHMLSKINTNFRNLSLPSELLSKRNKLIRVRFGNAISVKDQKTFTSTYQFGRFLRAKTYSMQNVDLEVKPFFRYKLNREKRPKEIIPPVDKNLLLKEINEFPKENNLLTIKNYTVYCAAAQNMPNILREIGRLREITFREIGEGTNRSIDVDEFDLYYQQMFIWDNDEDKIVGAYRLGLGKEILDLYNVKGFYLNSLFKMKKDFEPYLKESIELGRSFVVKEYQRKPLPLFLLWKGILYYLLKNPEYRYLIGPVSISNEYSKISKDLIVQFISRHFSDFAMWKMVKPRKAYKYNSENADTKILIDKMDSDIRNLDKAITDIEKKNSGLPVLVKKYLKINAKIIAFNIDPKFNNCLDGFIMVDVFNIPKNTIESLSKEANDGSILERFYNNREIN